jgi:hypothetical protein
VRARRTVSSPAGHSPGASFGTDLLSAENAAAHDRAAFAQKRGRASAPSARPRADRRDRLPPATADRGRRWRLGWIHCP